jgi:hypothetical protein
MCAWRADAARRGAARARSVAIRFLSSNLTDDLSPAFLDDCDGVRLKIDDVTNYSFGQDDDGKPVVWAAGHAGWYEITPSVRYLSHYNDTIEAIDLFYFLVDQHQKLPRHRQRLGFKIDPFLTAYQKHTDYRIDDDDEAMETIHKHHKFLMKQMIEEREDIDWSKTYLWNHLVETYPEEVETLRATLAQVQNGIASSVEESSAEEMQSSGEEQAESSGEEAVESETESQPEEQANEEEPDIVDYTQQIWHLLNVLRKSPNFNMRHCGTEQLAFELQKFKDFPGSHEAAVAAIERSAEPLLKMMNEAKLRKKFNWSTRVIYDELESTFAGKIAEDTSILKTPANKPDKRHRQKSVLRPSGAGKARKRTRPLEDSEEEHAVGELPTLAPTNRHNRLPQRNRNVRSATVDTTFSMEDSPSRQLNGHSHSIDEDALPELPPPPEAQEMLELVAKEAKMVGRQHQTSHLEAFLGQWVM